jgi:hypothetical protein
VSAPFLPAGVDRPDFYVAAMGRSGSTMLCNWLASPPERLVFLEPFFLRPMNPRLLRIQLSDYGMEASDEEWTQREDERPEQRFARLMRPRLTGKSWALKEVLCQEHARIVDALEPRRVMITVRDIADVALSFFEKHRIQNNLDRFSDDWVVRYCVEESRGILDFLKSMENKGVATKVIRYEDVTKSPEELRSIADFVGWPGGGETSKHFAAFDRLFEVSRHGASISPEKRSRDDRNLGYDELRLAEAIVERCTDYQAAFGYC